MIHSTAYACTPSALCGGNCITVFSALTCLVRRGGRISQVVVETRNSHPQPSVSAVDPIVDQFLSSEWLAPFDVDCACPPLSRTVPLRVRSERNSSLTPSAIGW